jgi:hypothetical protein
MATMPLEMMEAAMGEEAPQADPMAPEMAEPQGIAFFVFQAPDGTLSVGEIPAAAVLDAESLPAADRKTALTIILESLKAGALAKSVEPTAGFQAGYEEG